MRIPPRPVCCLWCLFVLIGPAAAQIPIAPPIVRAPVVSGTAAPRTVVPGSVAPETIVTERVPARVVETVQPIVPPVTVTARPVVRETMVAPARVVTSWDFFGKMSYGLYDDGFTDDNWFYDYYELPPSTVAVEQPPAEPAGTRTSWRYDPLVEQRLFRW